MEYKEADIAADDVPLEQLSLLPYAFFSPRQEGRYLCNVCVVTRNEYGILEYTRTYWFGPASTAFCANVQSYCNHITAVSDIVQSI